MGSDTIRQLSMGYCCCSYNVYVRVTIDFYCRVVSQTLLCNADVLYITRIMIGCSAYYTMQTRSKTKAEKERRAAQFLCGIVEGFYGRPWTADQRKDLFARMKHLGMNTYIYAPKDDLKHRADWRQLYNSDEVELLQSLIQTAKMENVTFVYALSPGIDIIYSSEKEIKALHDKSEQVRCLGCDAFALLFDDIDMALNDADKKQFSSIVMAQLTVANALYEFLKCPHFFFCPTEYCESRANPSLEESDYLLTLGKKLVADIHILWTGPRVVSREITIDHIRRVAAVLQRKPVVWDNLHANDYDPKRVFLGPFAGRSVRLKEEIAGILLNPNCRYEANFLPFYTLAEWNSCHADADVLEEAESDAILEAGDVVPVAAHIVENASPKRLYHPLKALDEGIKKWIEYFNAESSTNSHASVSVEIAEVDELDELKPSTSCISLVARELNGPDSRDNQTSIVCFNAENTSVVHTVNSMCSEYSEPMDLMSVTKDDRKLPLESSYQNKGNVQEMLEVSSDISMDSSFHSDSEANVTAVDQVAIFVDMFYLPFEHGRRGIQMLQEFSWLHENSYVMRRSSSSGIDDQKVQEFVSDEWKRRCEDFVKLLRDVTRLYQHITQLPNRSVVQELFQYIYDAQGMASILEALVLWMAGGHLNVAPVDCDCFWRVGIPDVEPWTLSGGFLADLQKLLYSNANLADLFLLKTVLPLSLNCYTVRPYVDEDTKNVRYIWKAEDECASSLGILEGIKDERFFDKYIGAYISFATPRTCFIAVENDAIGSPRQVIGMICAALDAKEFAEKVRSEYIPKMCSKYKVYAEAEKGQSLSHNEEIERQWQSLHEDIAEWGPPSLSDYFYEQFPSQIDVRCHELSQDAVVFRRLVCITAIALSYNGSSGFFMVLNSSDSEKINLCSRIGLITLKEANVADDMILMGHSL
uniref:protein O-GlcNAcase n=3 Tax=Brugia TaxID=6278 RepID=A0A0H5SC35_BRUMA|nr:BMA-OGA-1 [Brugia malayi]